MSSEDILELLAESRELNKQRNITGMLLYRYGSFMQVMEGERYAVCDLFESVKQDPRHKNIDLIILEPTEKRAFDDWSMSFIHSEIEPDEEQRGVSGYLQYGNEARNAPLFPSIPATFMNMFAHSGRKVPQNAEPVA
ncbi:BLUF domain-containing protein [Oceanospirillum sp. D5]|uniref:BLUF domain-containing protein n=2 Tax=Oceanospirillum sediminis TaxID=2760088 RepID=A0A839IWA6_9GAMM|nr:BLUF domain-containing protein [Oceanospirillum sediminis]